MIKKAIVKGIETGCPLHHLPPPPGYGVEYKWMAVSGNTEITVFTLFVFATFAANQDTSC